MTSMSAIFLREQVCIFRARTVAFIKHEALIDVPSEEWIVYLRRPPQEAGAPLEGFTQTWDNMW